MDRYCFIADLAVVVSENKWDKIKDLYKGKEPSFKLIVCDSKEDASRFIEKKTLKLWRKKPKSCRSGAQFMALMPNGALFWSNGMMKDECLYSDEFIPVKFA